ncbi:MAG TPA: DinB family protein [Anaerolineales bacterium]|nr:DinB family protein [Anaerolineales bacterium]
MEFRVLYEELTSSTKMIRALLTGFSQEDARVKPAADSWSPLEVTCHLYDEEREDFREHLDFILNHQDGEWHRINPQAWVIERKYNEQDFDAAKEKFFAERRKSLEWLKGLSRADWNKTYTSPFGTSSSGVIFASWVAHDNLHLRQLVELRRYRIENITKPYDIQYAGDW